MQLPTNVFDLGVLGYLQAHPSLHERHPAVRTEGEDPWRLHHQQGHQVAARHVSEFRYQLAAVFSLV